MFIDNRYYADPITREVFFIDGPRGTIDNCAFRALQVTNTINQGVSELAIATDATGISKALHLLKSAFPSVPVTIVDHAAARNEKLQNIGGVNFNLATSPIWFVLRDKVIIHPVAMLIREFERQKFGKDLAKEMHEAYERAGEGLLAELLG